MSPECIRAGKLPAIVLAFSLRVGAFFCAGLMPGRYHMPWNFPGARNGVIVHDWALSVLSFLRLDVESTICSLVAGVCFLDVGRADVISYTHIVHMTPQAEWNRFL